jgi:hypothetical protein
MVKLPKYLSSCHRLVHRKIIPPFQEIKPKAASEYVGFAFKVLGWIDTVLGVETGPEGNGARHNLY